MNEGWLPSSQNLLEHGAYFLASCQRHHVRAILDDDAGTDIFQGQSMVFLTVNMNDIFIIILSFPIYYHVDGSFEKQPVLVSEHGLESGPIAAAIWLHDVLRRRRKQFYGPWAEELVQGNVPLKSVVAGQFRPAFCAGNNDGFQGVQLLRQLRAKHASDGNADEDEGLRGVNLRSQNS